MNLINFDIMLFSNIKEKFETKKISDKANLDISSYGHLFNKDSNVQGVGFQQIQSFTQSQVSFPVAVFKE